MGIRSSRRRDVVAMVRRCVSDQRGRARLAGLHSLLWGADSSPCVAAVPMGLPSAPDPPRFTTYQGAVAVTRRLTMEDVARLPEHAQRQIGEALCARPSQQSHRDSPLTEAAGSARFTIPWPPSVNALHSVCRGKILLSRAGRRYYQDAVVAVSSQLPKGSPPQSVPMRLHVLVHPPDRRRRDLDNLLKAACDVIQKAGVVTDDTWFHDIRILRGDVQKPAGLICSVEAI